MIKWLKGHPDNYGDFWFCDTMIGLMFVGMVIIVVGSFYTISRGY